MKEKPMTTDDHLRGLHEELRGYEASGRTDRAAQVRDEIDRLSSDAPVTEAAVADDPAVETEAAVADDPAVETADKPAAGRGRGRGRKKAD
jgi:hypothetical protein